MVRGRVVFEESTACATNSLRFSDEDKRATGIPKGRCARCRSSIHSRASQHRDRELRICWLSAIERLSKVLYEVPLNIVDETGSLKRRP
jgi:hypothetical protein